MKDIPAQNRISPQSRRERGERIFLFGGEIPPNKKVSISS